MSGIIKTFSAINFALSDAAVTLEKLRNGEIASDKILEEYIKQRNRSDLNALYEEFKKTFGNEGESIAFLPALSEDLHGNVPSDVKAKDTGFYPGMIYSNPLMNYMMRRALEKESPDKCYDLYVKGIDRLAADMNENTDSHYPPQTLIERITTPHLEKLSIYLAQKNKDQHHTLDDYSI